jgi:excinuclease ABC subunit A
MNLLLKLRDAGNTIVVIEHNLDVIRLADWIVELGPGGGIEGGRLVYEGPLSGLAKCKASPTARFVS